MTTDVNPLKRVRVDDSHNLLSDGSEDCPEIVGCNSPNLLTPKANALNRLQYAIASLPSPVKKTITQQSRKIIDFIILIEKKNDFIKRAADNEYAPCSARVNFKLTTAVQLIETEPFKELVRQCDKDILEFQQKLKMHTIAVAKNELQLFKSEILDIIHKIVRILNKYYIIKKGATNTDDNVKTSFLLTPDIPELEKVIKQLSRLTKEEITPLSKLFLDSLPGTAQDVPFNDLEELHRKTITLSRQMCVKIFEALHLGYEDGTIEQDRTKKIQELSIDVTTETATADAINMAEAETTFTADTVREMIAKEVNIVRKQYRNEFQQLKAEVKESRGAPRHTSQPNNDRGNNRSRSRSRGQSRQRSNSQSSRNRSDNRSSSRPLTSRKLGLPDVSLICN